MTDLDNFPRFGSNNNRVVRYGTKSLLNPTLDGWWVLDGWSDLVYDLYEEKEKMRRKNRTGLLINLDGLDLKKIHVESGGCGLMDISDEGVYVASGNRVSSDQVKKLETLYEELGNSMAELNKSLDFNVEELTGE